jgi:hypothetical protein
MTCRNRRQLRLERTMPSARSMVDVPCCQSRGVDEAMLGQPAAGRALWWWSDLAEERGQGLRCITNLYWYGGTMSVL